MPEDRYPIVLGKRYELQSSLGSGGMGTVFKAKDRLEDNLVALKRVSIPPDQILFGSHGQSAGFELALAQEFRALATLRHPHIISVYDYGFSRQGQPYYTMEYLDDSQTILANSETLSQQGKAELVIQMLQALVYLHRQGILHRDLKPTNVLVTNGRLKLLDFGISVATSRTMEHLTQTTSGTVAYLAPEIFQGEPYSRSSDLYGLGVIAFQLFTGQYPYNEGNLASMLFDIVSKPVDASTYGVNGRLASVLNRLLVKTREERYDHAGEVISDLSAAVGLPAPRETIEIRESFLKAAKFVGRQNELDELSGHLAGALDGQGAAVLVGGESGVGKSRLLDELRIRALVQGALVLQGQAVSNGRTPYQLWVDVLRSLALFSGLTDEEAAAIKPFVPDLERLVGREIPEGMAVTPQEARQRFTETVTQLLARLDQPAMILLEDLQWAGNESIQLLGELALKVPDQAVILVGSYRDDEPLPEYDRLTPATFLSLQRLTREDTAELSASILGQAGSDPQLISLLHRETEGNAFFLVEAVRTLAEEAGQLDQVSQMTYPESIMSGGIREILDRRLDRVPVEARPLLKLASVASRQLDLALLSVLEPGTDLEAWLAAVANPAVIEAQGENWRFAHDKLREEIKGSLSHEEHVALHRRVAEGLEKIYPDAPEQATALAFHWSIVGDLEKELYYSETAGRHAAETSASEDAITFFHRALELLRAQPASPERDEHELSILMELGPQLTIARGFGAPEMETTYLRAQELAERTEQAEILFRAIWGQWVHYNQVLDFSKASGLLKQLLQLANKSGDDSLILEANHAGWTLGIARGNHALTKEYVEQGLATYDSVIHYDHTQLYGHDPGMCAHATGSFNLWIMGYPDQALQLSEAGQALAEKLRRPMDIFMAEWGSGLVASWRGDYKDAKAHSQVLLKYFEELGAKLLGAYGLLLQGAALTGMGQPNQGLKTKRKAIELAIIVRADAALTIFLSQFLESCLDAGAVEEGLKAVQDELARSEITGQRALEPEVRRLHGELILAKDGGSTAEAEKEFQLALEIARRQSAKSLELRALMSLARLWKVQGKIEQARASLAECYEWFTEGLETADLVAARKLLDDLQ